MIRGNLPRRHDAIKIGIILRFGTPWLEHGLPNKNKSVHFRRILWLFPNWQRFAFISKKCISPFCLAFDWAFLLEKQKRDWVLTLVLWFWPRSLADFLKFGDPILRPVRSKSEKWVHSPQNNENTVQFCGDFVVKKRKKTKPVRRQMKKNKGI